MRVMKLIQLHFNDVPRKHSRKQEADLVPEGGAHPECLCRKIRIQKPENVESRCLWMLLEELGNQPFQTAQPHRGRTVIPCLGRAEIRERNRSRGHYSNYKFPF